MFTKGSQLIVKGGVAITLIVLFAVLLLLVGSQALSQLLNAQRQFAEDTVSLRSPALNAPLDSRATTPTCQPNWSVIPSPNSSACRDSLTAISAISSNDIWAVGKTYASSHDRTLIEHWNGNQWSIVPSPNPTTLDNHLQAVVAISTNDVWAAGAFQSVPYSSPLIVHWDGVQWNVVSSPIPAQGGVIEAMSAISGNDLWAVGTGDLTQTLTEHWDGTQWTILPSLDPGSYSYLYGVASLTANDVWAVGRYACKLQNSIALNLQSFFA